jgi:hypothetical protein
MSNASSRLGLWRYIFVPAMLAMLLGCPPPKTETKKGKEVPEAEAQAAKEKEILDLFKEKQPEDLPRIFLDKGVQTKDDPDGRFVLLRMARDYSAKEQDVDRAFLAVDELAKSFDIDALEWKRETMAKLIENSKSSDINYDLTNESLRLVDGQGPKRLPHNCVEADRYDIANALLDMAESTRKKINPKEIKEDELKELEAKVAATKKKIQEMEKEFEAAKAAHETLESKPDDKSANLTWGKYLCTIKGDWIKGLPMLEKSEDSELAPPAKKDIALPSNGDDQVKLGDDWWGLGEKEQGMARQQLKKRAAFWYKKAENSVAGLTQERIKKSIREVERKD